MPLDPNKLRVGDTLDVHFATTLRMHVKEVESNEDGTAKRIYFDVDAMEHCYSGLGFKKLVKRAMGYPDHAADDATQAKLAAQEGNDGK